MLDPRIDPKALDRRTTNYSRAGLGAATRPPITNTADARDLFDGRGERDLGRWSKTNWSNLPPKSPVNQGRGLAAVPGQQRQAGRAASGAGGFTGEIGSQGTSMVEQRRLLNRPAPKLTNQRARGLPGYGTPLGGGFRGGSGPRPPPKGPGPLGRAAQGAQNLAGMAGQAMKTPLGRMVGAAGKAAAPVMAVSDALGTGDPNNAFLPNVANQTRGTGPAMRQAYDERGVLGAVGEVGKRAAAIVPAFAADTVNAAVQYAGQPVARGAQALMGMKPMPEQNYMQTGLLGFGRDEAPTTPTAPTAPTGQAGRGAEPWQVPNPQLPKNQSAMRQNPFTGLNDIPRQIPEVPTLQPGRAPAPAAQAAQPQAGGLDPWTGQRAAPPPLTEADRTAKGDMNMIGSVAAYTPKPGDGLGKMAYGDSFKAAAPMASDAQNQDWAANAPAQRKLRGGFSGGPEPTEAQMAKSAQYWADQRKQTDAFIAQRDLKKAAFNPGMDRVNADGSIDTSMRQNAMAGLGALAQTAATPREQAVPSTALEEAWIKANADMGKADITAQGGLAQVQLTERNKKLAAAFPEQEQASMPGMPPTGYTPGQQGFGMQKAAAILDAYPNREDEVIGAVKQATAMIKDESQALQELMAISGKKANDKMKAEAKTRAEESRLAAEAFLEQLFPTQQEEE